MPTPAIPTIGSQLYRRAADDERARRILYRQRILPSQLDRARRRVAQLEAEAIVLSVHNLPELRLARAAGDKIAAEWLRRLGE